MNFKEQDKPKTTEMKAREETIVKLGAKFRDAFLEVRQELERDGIKVSLVEVVIACGAMQAVLYKEGYK